MAIDHALVDGSLSTRRTARSSLVERMAKDLLRFAAFGQEADAIRSLFGAGYSMADIVMLVDDARMLAYQDTVAKEMSESARVTDDCGSTSGGALNQ